jgi:hypothetical protein
VLVQRGEHDIENELTFTNNRGYVFHDSRGFEAGDGRELKIVQEFVRRRSLERNLNQRLHAIWFARLLLSVSVIANQQRFLFRYCVPMDNARPSLDLKYVDDICPDKNGTSRHNCMGYGSTRRVFLVPVIAVFTKYDQFRRDIWFKLEDQKLEPALLDTEVERIFKKEYLAKLRESAPFARLESESFVDQLACSTLNSVTQRCTRRANSVLSLLKGLPMSSLVVPLLSCSWLFKRKIWS